MKLTNRIIIIFFLGLVLAMFFLNSNQPKPVNWSRNYSPLSKSPYGYYILNQQIDHFFDEKVLRYGLSPYEFFSEELYDSLKNYNFIITNYADDASKEKILKKVENGSVAFSLYYSVDTLKVGTNDFSTTKGFYHLDNEQFIFDKEKFSYYFHLLDDAYQNRTKALGYAENKEENQKYVNFIKIKHGKGYIYHFLSREAFSNYYLLDENTNQYGIKALSLLPKENATIWFSDEFYNEKAHFSTDKDFFLEDALSRINPEMKTSLQEIFKYPALKRAWQVLFLGFIFYIIFMGKRRQRIIPKIEKLKNTTIEFVQAIANLHFSQNNSTEILQKKILYFLEYLRNNFYLQTDKIDEELVNKLISKTAKNPELITKITDFIINFQKKKTASDQDLVYFDSLLQEFYR